MSKSRFVSSSLPKSQAEKYNPTFDYENLHVLGLEDAVQDVIHLVPGLTDYLLTIKAKCIKDSGLLTDDESAAIYLYTTPQLSFSSRLNTALRANTKHNLKPWLKFLKLFIVAVDKISFTKATLWRGINYDARLKFVDNDTYTWWEITSCSKNTSSVQSFLGESGTLFAIEAIYGKDISTFSAVPDEEEVILMPGTNVRARSQACSFIERLFIIHLEEIAFQSDALPKSKYLLEQIKHGYQRNSRIERFMNPSSSFPIEQSYINLSIVEKKEQREKEKLLHDAQGASSIMGTYEDIYGTKTAIDIKNIFEICKNYEKQVLVFGRAGIGKSTFCRYITYQWAIGSYWSHYELLALIPLRRLTIHRYPPLPPGQSYSLIDLVKKELFPHDLDENEEEVFNKHFDAKKTLWILDGYDEIVQNVPSHLQCLFEQLLKTPHHIITSRPYLNTLSHNIQMEITGFTDENIRSYVQNFFNQMRDESDDATTKGEKLLSYLRSNLSIWGIAHIPLLLELICSLWSNQDLSRIGQLTMTRLYTKMTEWLCRRYASVQDNQILQLSQDEINRHCQKELAFMETLAFHAMQSNTIIIRPASLQKALNEAKLSLKEHRHILNIGILKSFHDTGVGDRIEMNKDHYFVHLSFLEYFAARHLIHAFEGSQMKEAIQFIKYQKYNQRCTLLLTFAANLLSEKDDTLHSSLFWNTLLGEPLDLVGIRHLQLIIACVNEIASEATIPHRSDLIPWIGRCVNYNVATQNEIMCKHLSYSLKRAQSIACDPTIITVLINLLQNQDVTIRKGVLSFIFDLEISTQSTVLTKAVVNQLNDVDPRVRKSVFLVLQGKTERPATKEAIDTLFSALEDEHKPISTTPYGTLGKMGRTTVTYKEITKLASALDDELFEIRDYACETLGWMREKAATNEVIAKLLSVLGDKDASVRSSAYEVLGWMGKKGATNEVITKLVTALGDEDEGVRNSACEALGMMRETAATNEVITKLVTALGDKHKFVGSSASIALVRMGGKAATNEVITKLASALGDESTVVRIGACETLGLMGEKAATNEVITKLVSVLGDEDAGVRSSACKTLGKMGEKAATNEVITKLVTALGDENAIVRRSACKALGKMGEKAATNEVITKLVSVLGDEDFFVRSRAFDTLGWMREKAATNEVITKLVTALGDEDEGVRNSACEALGMMRETAATNEVITKLVIVLGDESTVVRSSAFKTLGDIGEKAATNEVITKLVIVLGDESTVVRSSAFKTLGKMGEKAATNEVITKLVIVLGDESTVVRSSACETLGMMRETAATNEVITKLVTALGDEDFFVRSSAFETLGEMGAKAATNEMITKLVSVLGDEYAGVRSSACKTLGKMGEKAATNEVISKLVGLVNNNLLMLDTVTKTLEYVLCSSAAVHKLDPKIFVDIYLCGKGSIPLNNIAMEDLFSILVNTENSDWLFPMALLALQKGIAVTLRKNEVTVFGDKEPSQLVIADPKLRQRLMKAFIDQGIESHLYFSIPSESRKKSSPFCCHCNIS